MPNPNSSAYIHTPPSASTIVVIEYPAPPTRPQRASPHAAATIVTAPSTAHPSTILAARRHRMARIPYLCTGYSHATPGVYPTSSYNSLRVCISPSRLSTDPSRLRTSSARVTAPIATRSIDTG